jgi:L-alanine-DL-glutamate epimerase-like enolase superfamily enzyme
VKEAAPAELPLMFYPGCSYNLDQALEVGTVLDALGYALFVDPISHRGPHALADYRVLGKRLRTAVCGPIEGGLEMRLEWLKAGAVDMMEIDLYAGFTPCLRFIRACAKAGVPLDLHAGFPMDIYHFPLNGFVDDKVLPWIGWHSRSPKWVPIVTKFRGSETKPQRQPWLKRVQARPVDADGYVRLVYELPGMGVEPDWQWIKRNEIQK